MTRHVLCLMVFAALTNAPPASPATVVDQGNFIFYQRGQVIGAENFTFEARGDSLNVFARTYQQVPTDQGKEQLDKQLVMVLALDDFALRMYQSNQKFRGRELVRGVTIEGSGDTAFTVYRELDGRGEADRLPLPPGRVFVVDSQMFSLFNIITMSLKDRTFESWPLTLFTLSTRDSAIAATATMIGNETLRWGARPVTTRKFKISDGTITFLVWANLKGQMLRLEHVETAMRVEREAPAVKRREPKPPPTPKPGG